MIFLVHPKHGTHIAYSQLEVDECLKNGWVVREDKKKEPEKKRGRPRKVAK